MKIKIGILSLSILIVVLFFLLKSEPTQHNAIESYIKIQKAAQEDNWYQVYDAFTEKEKKAVDKDIEILCKIEKFSSEKDIFSNLNPKEQFNSLLLLRKKEAELYKGNFGNIKKVDTLDTHFNLFIAGKVHDYNIKMIQEDKKWKLERVTE